MKIRERPLNVKTSATVPLGGGVGSPGAPTTLCQRHRWWAQAPVGVRSLAKIIKVCCRPAWVS
jgi:hypothetical protein